MTTTHDFSGRTLLLTGAVGSIGRAVAERFFASGANCVITDIDETAASALARDLDPELGRVLALGQDAAKPDDAARVARAAVERFGAIDFVVTSAGLYRDALVAEMSDAEWRRSIDINLDGVFYTCRAAIPHLRDGGSIVNIASMAGHRGSFAHAHYAAAKGAVLTFSRSLALELAPKIRVNAVSPGLIDGPMVQNLLQMNAGGARLIEQTPLKRLGRPEEIASVIAFLCSPDAAFMTGTSLHVNGGLHIAS